MWYGSNEKAELQHIKWISEWKLWGCPWLQQDLAPGLLQNCCPWLNPVGLQETIYYRGAHPHGVNAWLPPWVSSSMKKQRGNSLFNIERMERLIVRKTNNYEVTVCPKAPTLPNTVLSLLWNPQGHVSRWQRGIAGEKCPISKSPLCTWRQPQHLLGLWCAHKGFKENYRLKSQSRGKSQSKNKRADLLVWTGGMAQIL